MQHISILLLVFSTVVSDVCSGNLFTRLNVDLKGLGLVHFLSYKLGDGIYSGKYFLDSNFFGMRALHFEAIHFLNVVFYGLFN